jgi:methanogenic corrinoid protein MtbC1
MGDQEDNLRGLDSRQADTRGEERLSGAELSFLPPLAVDIDDKADRQERLAATIADYVIPRLLALHCEIPDPPAHFLKDRPQEVAELARLVLGPDNDDAADYILRLKDGGLSLDTLHLELLEPTARHLGELWHDDRIDFVDVTLGVSKLQRLVHVFEGLDRIAPYDEKRKVLIACAPGDQHSLGTVMVQKFLRASGWYVCSCATPRIEEAADIAAGEWFGVVGFSLGSDVHLDNLKAAVSRVRHHSKNRKVGVMVGGSAIARNPDWVSAVGADGTAVNGPTAVILAKKLLIAGLSAP